VVQGARRRCREIRHGRLRRGQTEIARLNREIKAGRADAAQRKSLGTAFVECTLQLGAHVLAQCVSYHEPLVMARKWIEVRARAHTRLAARAEGLTDAQISPKDVIWENLDVRTRARAQIQAGR
jgi:hypothetical protein